LNCLRRAFLSPEIILRQVEGEELGVFFSGDVQAAEFDITAPSPSTNVSPSLQLAFDHLYPDMAIFAGLDCERAAFI
jgi:hypothetical protein